MLVEKWRTFTSLLSVKGGVRRDIFLSLSVAFGTVLCKVSERTLHLKVNDKQRLDTLTFDGFAVVD